MAHRFWISALAAGMIASSLPIVSAASEDGTVDVQLAPCTGLIVAYACADTFQWGGYRFTYVYAGTIGSGAIVYSIVNPGSGYDYTLAYAYAPYTLVLLWHYRDPSWGEHYVAACAIVVTGTCVVQSLP